MVPGSKLCKDEDGTAIHESYYNRIIESLMYLTSTRPDLVYSVSLISRYMAKPTEIHLQATKRILRYLKGTFDYGIMYRKGDSTDLIAYINSDYASDVDDRKSTSGYMFLLSSGAVSWVSKKQPIVTLLTTKVEFMAVAGCATQVVWMRKVLQQLGREQEKSIIIM